MLNTHSNSFNKVLILILKNGLVVVWKTDANGKLVQPPLAQFNINEKVTDIICKPSGVSQKEKYIPIL